MTSIVKRDNLATIPAEIAVAFGIREGTRLEWTDTGSGMIAVKPLHSRSERARALMGSGRKWLKPGDDPIADLLRDRDPHFLGIPPTLLTQEMLPRK